MSEVKTVERLAPSQWTNDAKGPVITPTQITGPDKDEVEPSKTSACDIKYTYSCTNQDGKDFVESYSNPLDLQVQADDSQAREACVFELVTETMVKLPEGVLQPHDKADFSLKSMQIQRLGPTTIKIHSTPLLEAIRDVVKYYPSQNLIGDTVTVREPYAALMHHYSALEDLKCQLENSVSESADDESSVKSRHIQLLLDHLHPRLQQSIVPAEKRLDKTPPTVAFADIWFLLQPGVLSYFVHENITLAGTVTRVEYQEETSDKKAQCKVKVAFQDFLWYTHIISGSCLTIDIEDFDGEKEVTSLPVYPCHSYDDRDGGQRKETFIRRGAAVMDILQKNYKYTKYNGKFMDEKKTEYAGPIIAGFCPSTTIDLPDHGWTFEIYGSEVDYEREAKFPSPAGVVLPILRRLDQNSQERLKDGHLLTMCPIMPAFALSTKSWEVINVESIVDLDEPETTPDADINPKNLRIIKALAKRQINSKHPWSADFIEKKGEGVVVLLHGPPGVGKTYTVENIALSVRRPLIALTIADLGTKEDSVEASLTKWFSFAQKWRAILLLDEADIFLERREHKDLSRNGIVSAFLRKMEYFGGLLFLTTYRVGHIDEAFISRVHVIIGFEKLDPSKRKRIWANFLDKLNRERKGRIRVTPGGRSFAQGDEMGAMEWNGREIRNALQTAIALAEYDLRESGEGDDSEILVEAEHFRRVMEMSKSFRDYMDSIAGDTEGVRARQLYGRNDYFQSEGDQRAPG